MLPADLTPDAWTFAVAAWLAAVGGVIGSFLNVVVYRLPAGIGIVRPASHCPACKHPIRWHDNVPVLGWLLLRGRCRDCRAPISPRYPLVEAAVAGVFLLLGVFELLTAGQNLPVRPAAVPGGTILAAMTVREAAAVYVYHLVLWCTLLAAALVAYDGLAPPWRLFLPALVWGLAGALVWPHVHPVPAFAPAEGWLAGLIDSAAGLAAGTAVGVVPMLWRRRPACQDAAGTAALQAASATLIAAALTGLYLGWQAGAALVGAAAVLDATSRLASRGLRRKDPGPAQKEVSPSAPRKTRPFAERQATILPRVPFTAWLVVGLPVWLLLWRDAAAWWRG